MPPTKVQNLTLELIMTATDTPDVTPPTVVTGLSIEFFGGTADVTPPTVVTGLSIEFS